MVNNIRKIVFLISFLLLFLPFSKAQLIINEISQGPSGSKEYVELLVAGVSTCSNIPCLDLRGYYFDDNNGNYATGTGTGIAQGCIRFKNIAFWSCIPIGTLIVIYNDADLNSSIPADDISMADGNCKLVIPISNCTLLEENTSLPSTTTATYPSTGFTACGSWGSLAMANGDDSFQTLNNAGNPIFSVSWGNNSTNPIIYFSGTSAAMVAYMDNTVDDNPNNQGNWTRVSTSGNQTPGSANNSANAAWISTMNNSCSALTPLVLTTSSTNPSCVCDGTISVSATGANPPYAYSWAPYGGSSATVSGLCAGTYTVTVTSANGCTQTATETIVASVGLTVTVNSETICAGETATLTASGGSTYSWSTGATSGSITESPSSTTSYTVTGTNGGCSGIAIATVTVSAALTITVNSETICTGQTATLSATGGTTYLWSTGSTDDSITDNPSTTTSYTVTGTNGGCSGTAIATVTVGGALTITVNSETICAGQTATLTASGAANYLWSTGSTSNSITDTPSTTTSYTVTGTSGGCSGNAIATVTVGGALAITVNSETICTGQTATLTASGAANYLWSTGSTSNSITDTPGTTTSYTVTGTNGGCSGSAIATVTVGGALTITVNSETICAGQTATLTASGGTTYSWSTGAISGSITESPSSTTSYTVTGTNGGCSGSAIATVALNTLPNVVFNANTFSGCEPFCVTFTDASYVIGDSITSWNWDFGDGGISAVQHPQHCFNIQGQFSITLTVNSKSGCMAAYTSINMITLDTFPVAKFFVPLSSGIFDPTIAFTDHSIGASSWNWNFGEVSDSTDNTSNLVNPFHTYSKPGTYCATLAINNNAGCMDTSQLCFVISPEITFYIPNTFSPNGDGINDEFYGKGENISEFEMYIYDRWGDLIFSAKDINEHWNGKANKGNKIALQDVYIYVVTFKDINNENYQYRGNVTLVR